MLGQSKSVRVDFFAKPTAIFADFILDFGKLRLGFLSNLYHIELGRNVTCQKDHFALDVFCNVRKVALSKLFIRTFVNRSRNFFTLSQFPNDGTGNG